MRENKIQIGEKMVSIFMKSGADNVALLLVEIHNIKRINKYVVYICCMYVTINNRLPFSHLTSPSVIDSANGGVFII